MTIQELFKLGMKRDIPELLDFPDGHVLNLGCGKSHIKEVTNLDLPLWDANKPCCLGIFATESIAGIHAYHFLEHADDPVAVLRECYRVLKRGGVMNIVVPYYKAQIAFQDLGHKHFFTENTWRTLLENMRYDTGAGELGFNIHANFIMGLIDKDLCLFTQLQKRGL